MAGSVMNIGFVGKKFVVFLCIVIICATEAKKGRRREKSREEKIAVGAV